MKCILAVCAFAIAISGIPAMFPQQAEAADNELFQQMDIGFFSIGGRAVYYDPNEGQSRWFGGAQVRVNPFKYLSFEGSADYRQQDTAGSSIHTYPVQVSALIYPLGHSRLAPFLLGGGGWYYTTVSGPGNFSDTQNRFGLHAGGGLQFFFNNHISIDSTYRYIWLEDIRSRDQNIKDKNFNDNGHMITVGLNFHF
ncbi:MAG: porin family protein [Nitrospiraceae bacterium]